MNIKKKKNYAKVSDMYHAQNGLVRYVYKDPSTGLQNVKFITKTEAIKMGVWVGE